MRMKLRAWLSSLLLIAMLLVGCIGPMVDEETPSVPQTTQEVETTEEAAETESETESQVETETEAPETTEAETESEWLDEEGSYTSKEEVALYLYQYGHLPDNFITKSEAKELGWVSSEGNLWKVAPGMSIGGDYFGNREGLLPEAKGRDYYECDIDSDGKYRNSKRIVFSNDGLIYYTEDHYESFELLYGTE